MRTAPPMFVLATVVACTASPSSEPFPKADRTWIDVSAGRHVSCAVDDAHRIECWGDNSAHEFDTGWVNYEEDVPPEETGILDVELDVRLYYAYGSGSACALRTDHSVVCWGVPTEEPAADVRLVGLGMSAWGPCGITEVGAGACWARRYEQPAWPPSTSLSTVRTSGDAACFVGADGIGDCGYVAEGGWRESSRFPVREGPYALLVPAELDICGLGLDGSLECWDRYDATIDGRLTVPPEGAPFQDFCWSAGGLEWGCALDADNRLQCFGGYDSDPRWQWDVLPDDTPLVSISCGAFHVCGLTAEGAIHCYGDDTYDQLDVP